MSRDWTNLLWREKTWSERSQTVIAWTMALAVGLGMFVGALLVVGSMVDGVARYNSEHRHCLQQATNGLEIEQCR